jgi:hypothetical protein
MSESLETVLRLVADGRITAAEAERILRALDDPAAARGDRPPDDARPATGRPRYVRIEVTEDGRVAVNLRLPASLGELAMLKVPGLARPEIERIREAIRTGLSGPIVTAEDDAGNGVRIVVE